MATDARHSTADCRKAIPALLLIAVELHHFTNTHLTHCGCKRGNTPSLHSIKFHADKKQKPSKLRIIKFGKTSRSRKPPPFNKTYTMFKQTFLPQLCLEWI